MFAEFEKIAHSMVQNGEGVTADRLVEYITILIKNILEMTL